MTSDDPHTVHYPAGAAPAWEVVYWRGNAACGAHEASRAVVRQFVPRSGYVLIAEFELPTDHDRLDALLRALCRAHEAGKAARSAEILSLLGADKDHS